MGATRPVALEWERFPICRGAIAWDPQRLWALDVDRYPTIVEIRAFKPYAVAPTKVPYLAPMGPGQRPAYFYPADAWVTPLAPRLEGERRARFAAASFAGPTLTPPDLRGLKIGSYDEPPRPKGGWVTAMLGSEELKGLVFLPIPTLADTLQVGCPEGHVVWARGPLPGAYLADVRRIIELRRDGPVDDAQSDPRVDAALREGDYEMGLYLAEHLGWKRATQRLREAPRERATAAVYVGLAKGLLRMRTLSQITSYTRAGWKDPDLSAVEHAVARWTLDVVRAASPGSLERSATRMVEWTHATFPNVGGVGVGDGVLSALRSMPWLQASSGHSGQPFAEPWSRYRIAAFRRWLEGREDAREIASHTSLASNPCRDEAPVDRGMLTAIQEARRRLRRRLLP